MQGLKVKVQGEGNGDMKHMIVAPSHFLARTLRLKLYLYHKNGEYTVRTYLYEVNSFRTKKHVYAGRDILPGMIESKIFFVLNITSFQGFRMHLL